jgi:DNA polymerase III subunit delta'
MIHAWNRSLWTSLHSGSGTPIGSLLLAGPQGVGKRAFALALAQGLLCANPQTAGEPCGACMSCRLFAADSHPDFRRLEPALEEGRTQITEEGSTGGTAPPVREGASILVGQVRALADFLVIASQLAGRKVVLIQPADRLHPSAANALLKTLEEPLAGTVFILVADHPQRLVPTIRSRCFRVDFSLPSREAALKWLEEERVEQPEVALAQAGFAPLTAVTLDRSDFPSRRLSLSEILVSPDPAQLVASVDPGEVSLVCQLLQRWCYDLLSLRLADQVRYNPDYAAKLRGLADKVDVHQLQTLIKELADAARALEHPLNPRLVIEHLAIRYTRMISRQPS